MIGYRFRFYGGPVTIVPSNDVLGSARGEEPWCDRSRYREYVIGLYAGGAAQRRFDPSADLCGCGRDNEWAADLLACIEGDDEISLRAEAARMVAENWPAIQAVAGELLRSGALSEDEWSIIVDAIDEGDDPNKTLAWMRARLRESGMMGEGEAHR